MKKGIAVQFRSPRVWKLRKSVGWQTGIQACGPYQASALSLPGAKPRNKKRRREVPHLVLARPEGPVVLALGFGLLDLALGPGFSVHFRLAVSCSKIGSRGVAAWGCAGVGRRVCATT